MSLTPHQAIQQIDLIGKQAAEARDAGQYALAETLLVEAVRLADAHADLATRIKLHYWLATSRRMQSRYEETLPTYLWLVSLANDRQQAADLAQNANNLWYLASAFIQITEVGRFLPQMPLANLYQVIDQGLAFLADVGRAKWAHALRFQKALLLQEMERKLAEARQLLEEALAQARRSPGSPGASLAAYLNHLGSLLIKMGEYDAAAKYLHEVFEQPGCTNPDRYRAQIDLAWLERERENWDAAEQWARETVSTASQIEDPGAQFNAYNSLVRVLMRRGKLAELGQASAAMWGWGRRCVTVRDAGQRRVNVNTQYFVTSDLANVRLAMARAVLGLSSDPYKAIPEKLPAFSAPSGRLALRYLRAAERWLGWAQAPAQRLDRSGGVTHQQDWLRGVADKIAQLRRLVEAGASR